MPLTQNVGTVKLARTNNFPGVDLGNSPTQALMMSSALYGSGRHRCRRQCYGFSLDATERNLGIVDSPQYRCLPQGADGIIGDSDDKMLKAAVYTDLGNSNGHISFSVSEPLSASTLYYVNVTGVTSGSLGGAYSGAIQLALAPVPEPETYAMLLAGLGLMGAVVRRRSSRKTS